MADFDTKAVSKIDDEALRDGRHRREAAPLVGQLATPLAAVQKLERSAPQTDSRDVLRPFWVVPTKKKVHESWKKNTVTAQREHRSRAKINLKRIRLRVESKPTKR